MNLDPLTREFDEAFAAGDAGAVRRLIEIHGKDVRLFHNTAPFHLAALHCKNTEILDYLRSLGADLYAMDKYGSTTLHFAVMGDNFIALHWLLDNGFDPNMVPDDNYTALHEAAMAADGEAAALLLSCGALVDGVSIHCECAPLHEAARMSVACIHLLIRHGADINRQDRFGYPPIAHALGWSLMCDPTPRVEEAKALLQYEEAMVIDDVSLLDAIAKFKLRHGI